MGTGLDTVKYMYPIYRRPEYGKLEGGHNYTPDRLHNEYLNTLTTKGIFGFIAYYIIFIGGSGILLLKGIHKHSNSPNQYLILGTLGGAFIYLGQVLFNFGVVATLALFFILISISIGYHNNTKNELNDE